MPLFSHLHAERIGTERGPLVSMRTVVIDAIQRLGREDDGESLVGYGIAAGIVSIVLKPELPVVVFHRFSTLVELVAGTLNSLT